MPILEEIRDKFNLEEFEFSKHATDQSILRDIRVDEIREAVQSGVVIEYYPEDKYGPSCMILGYSKSGRPLHVQCSYRQGSLVRVITVYEPDPQEWIDYRTRR